MLINEVCKACRLTKKAIEYYEEQGLICPAVMENGYRQFLDDDISRLKKISILRGLGLSVSEIRSILGREDLSLLHDVQNKKEFEIADLQAKQELIKQLVRDEDWNHIRNQLDILEQKQSVLMRLLEKFPGYYGRYISLHFARFLDEPITTLDQQEAFDTIIDFLDGVDIKIPKDLMEYYDEMTKDMDSSVINNTLDNLSATIKNPKQFLKDNKEILEQFKTIAASEEYKATPIYRLQELLKRLNSENGYNDIFIPAMKRLSRSYQEYYSNLINANQIFIEHFQSESEQ